MKYSFLCIVHNPLIRSTKYLFFLLVLASVFFSCKKEGFTNNIQDKLELRADTLWFDTVFTQVTQQLPKSVNKQIVIVNPHHSKKIKTDILLAGGQQSHFRLNVDGVPGHAFQDIEIFPQDSLFLFVEVHPDPNNNSPDFNPLIIRDSILFHTNGNEQKVNLIGWGQDAHYIFRDSIEQDTTWSNSKLPIVVYGYLYVKPNVTLSIDPGMQVHFSPYSWLYVEGALDIRGTESNPVVIQGDRLQPDWEETPGQWGGVWIAYPSKDNYFEHAIIKNATVGIYCDTLSGDDNATPNAIVHKSFIRNMLYDGIATRYGSVQMSNSLVANCGRFTFLASFGGDYNLRHCTFHTGSKDFSRSDPTFALLNINRDALGAIISQHPIDFYMANSIIYGSRTDGELGTDLNGSANITVFNSLIKTSLNEFNVNNNLLNVNPLFLDANNNQFGLDTLSPAKDAGAILNPMINDDYRDQARDAQPDMGAYESDF